MDHGLVFFLFCLHGGKGIIESFSSEEHALGGFDSKH
jgi:hypothetical protein